MATISKLASSKYITDKHYDRQGNSIMFLTPHHMAGKMSGANCAQYFVNNGLDNSCNYCIGFNGDISCNVPEEYGAWTSSCSGNDRRAITFECSDTAAGDWTIPAKTQESLIQLCVDLIQRYPSLGGKMVFDPTDEARAKAAQKGTGSWSALKGNVTLHKWFGATSCPEWHMIKILPDICAEVNKRLAGKTATVPVNTPEKTKDGDEILKEGSSGSSVKTLQTYLIKLGYSCGSAGVDGDFGPATLAAVKKFQTDKKLEVDGIVGQYTWTALKTAIKELNASSSKGGYTVNLTGKNNAEKIWNYLYKELKNPYGVAGIMGNMKAESNLVPNNLQNTYEKSLGMTDELYTKAVDDGSYTNFIKDKAGYGLVQWTYWSLKEALYNYVKEKGASIGDLGIQLEFLVYQLKKDYKKTVWDVCAEAKDVRTASDAMLLKFERPADQSEKVQQLRAGYGQAYFDEFSSTGEGTGEGSTIAKFTPRLTRPTAGNKYYIRKASGGWSNAIKGSPTDSQCDVLSNCVGYAYGRFNEIGGYGSCKYLSPVNAENFMEYAVGLATGKTPQLGACMVWQKGATLSDSDGAGHVAIVEKIISDTEIVTSESGWGSSTPFWTQTRKKGDGNWGQNSQYTFRGFIYNPAISDKTTQEKDPTEDLVITPADEVLKYAVGDIVNFTGKTHYTSSYKTGTAKTCKPGEAKVTQLSKGKAHPYHLKATSGSKSTVSGWVNAVDIANKIVQEDSSKQDIKPTDSPEVTSSKMKYNDNNKPLVCMMTNSTCYLQTRTMTPKGILWHSTGANNPNLKRYVQPSKNDKNYSDLMKKLGTNSYGNDWNHVSVQAGLNAWIGKLADGTVTTVQTMPWNYRPWGCASGSKGSCNDNWIQFEICEDDLSNKSYFNTVYKEAIELTAYLCKMYNLNPKGTVNYNGVNVPVILCHQDSYKLGLGSNHGDVYHWFNKYGKTMDDVRNDVFNLLSDNTTPGETITPTTPVVVEPSYKDIKVGDIITLASNATYTSGKSIPQWVFKSTLYAREIRANEIVFSTLKTGAITGVVSKNYVSKKADGSSTFQPYLVIITASVLNVRSGPSTSYKINTTVKKNEVYTIVGEQNGWGKLKSGAGWICLDYTKKK